MFVQFEGDGFENIYLIDAIDGCFLFLSPIFFTPVIAEYPFGTIVLHAPLYVDYLAEVWKFWKKPYMLNHCPIC